LIERLGNRTHREHDGAVEQSRKLTFIYNTAPRCPLAKPRRRIHQALCTAANSAKVERRKRKDAQARQRRVRRYICPCAQPFERMTGGVCWRYARRDTTAVESDGVENNSAVVQMALYECGSEVCCRRIRCVLRGFVKVCRQAGGAKCERVGVLESRYKVRTRERACERSENGADESKG
jgi:hypothetical protein